MASGENFEGHAISFREWFERFATEEQRASVRRLFPELHLRLEEPRGVLGQLTEKIGDEEEAP